MENKSTITKKEMIQMDRTSSSIKGVVDNLEVQLQILDDEIKADEASKYEFERHLGMLQSKRNDLMRNMNANDNWAETFDKDIGPFTAKYNQMTTEIGILYDNAKKGHTKGISLLEREFGYHPAFKRPQDTFTASSFRPK